MAKQTTFRGLVIFGHTPDFEVVDWDLLHEQMIDSDGWRRRDFRRSRAAGRLLPRLRVWIDENWGRTITHQAEITYL